MRCNKGEPKACRSRGTFYELANRRHWQVMEPSMMQEDIAAAASDCTFENFWEAFRFPVDEEEAEKTLLGLEGGAP